MIFVGLLIPPGAVAQDRATGTQEPSPTSLRDLSSAPPESVGLSSEELDEATRALERRVADGDIAGAVAAVARHGRLVYLESVGSMDLESGRPMTEDALFRIYSMTRPITSLAAMILWEEGAFDLDDPVSQYLPQFANQRVFEDPDAPRMDRTRERRGEMTVEHLLLHTSGLGSRSSAIYRQEGVRSRAIPLTEMVDNAARTPLFEDPGTRWRYGISTTILGRLVEIWSGRPLDVFMEERIFGPLGMDDTGFWVEPGRADRLATVYRPGPDGELRPVRLEEVPFTERPALLEGGVGLVTSTRDFLRFCQMFLNGGELDGSRIVQPETVALMTRNRVPDALLPIGFSSPMHGAGWTLGFNVVLDPAYYDHPMQEGEFWWDGSAGTRFWIDPVNDMVTVIHAQVSPASGNGFREEFKRMVYGALVD
ncbi:MAG: serine hydrolase domain-containing protein [Longimicrobiales bacterium]|nr:serine hydrolase domain-containing protein [Longimicrobiales bacterium]